MAQRVLVGISSGMVIGALDGLIGVGGAQFRLPFLVALLGMTPQCPRLGVAGQPVSHGMSTALR